MTISKFFKKNKWVVNQSRIEKKAKVPVNTISHAAGRDNRKILPVYEDKIRVELQKLHNDLTEVITLSLINKR